MYEIIAFAVLYVIEAIVAVLYLDYLYERKRNNWKLFLSFALAYCALFGISRFKMTTLNAISFTVINACLIAYNYRCKLTMATVHSFMLCFLVMCAEILVSLVIAWFGYDFSAYLQNFSVMLTLIVWSKFLYVIFVVVTARFFKPKKRENIEPGTTFLFCILPIFSAIAATAIIYIGMHTGVDSSKAIVITIAISSLLIMNLLFAGINEYVQKVNYEKTMLQLSIQKDQADADHYKAMQEQFENQRVLVHDIKNHLGTMEAMANRNEIEQIRRYLKNLNKTFLITSGDGFKEILLCYYTNQTGNVACKRFTTWIGDMSRTDLCNKISPYCNDHSTILFIKWPILSSFSIYSYQQDAFTDAFVDYLLNQKEMEE